MTTSARRVRTAELPASAPAGTLPSIVVELGKHRAKSVKRLRQGRGKLVDRVISVVDELRRAGTLAEGAEPVVLVIREKAKVRAGLLGARGR